MRWCFEDHSPYADQILSNVIAGSKACVPQLWLYEVISVMAESQRRGALSADKARDFFEDLRSLDIEVDREADREHIFGSAHPLAVRYRLSGYDAAYLELAIRRRLPLASLDHELNNAASEAGVVLVET